MKREGTCWSGVLGQGLYPPLILSRIHLRKMTGDLCLRKKVSRYSFHIEMGNVLGCTTGIQDVGTPVREAVKEVFSWGEGTYSFVVSSVGGGARDAGGRATADMILKGVREIRNLYLVEEALGRSEGLVQLSDNPPDDSSFQFSPLESYLFSRLEGTSTVEGLSRLSPVTRPETLCSIYVLLCAGVVNGGGDPLQQEPVAMQVHPSFSRSRQRFVPETVTGGMPLNNSWRKNAHGKQ